MAKPMLARVGKTCESGNTLLVVLNKYGGEYLGMLQIRDAETKAQFRSGNIKKVALLKENEFISANNYGAKNE